MEETKNPEAQEQTQDQTSQDKAEPKQEKQNEELIPRSEFERAMKDLHKFKSTAREYEQKLKEREENELKTSQRWEDYAKIKEQEALSAKEQLDSFRSQFQKEKLYDAVKQEALSKGIRREALEDLSLLELEGVMLEETNTGRNQVIGHSSFVDKLKTTRPHWFQSQTARVNTDLPHYEQGGEVSLSDVMAAQKEAQKSGNNAKYFDLMRRYKSQKG